jgi:hypothetical protein
MIKHLAKRLWLDTKVTLGVSSASRFFGYLDFLSLVAWSAMQEGPSGVDASAAPIV